MSHLLKVSVVFESGKADVLLTGRTENQLRRDSGASPEELVLDPEIRSVDGRKQQAEGTFVPTLELVPR